jgi:hypothetical protein
VWSIVRRARFDVALAAILLGSILLTRHAYLQDCAIIIGSLVMLFRRFTHPLICGCALALLLPFTYVLSLRQGGGVIAALYLLLLAAVGLVEIQAARTSASASRAEVLNC